MFHLGDGALHEGAIPDALDIRGSFVVVIEGPTVVLVDDNDLVAGGTQPMSGVDHSWSNAEDGVIQGDLAHWGSPSRELDIVQRSWTSYNKRVSTRRFPGQRAGLTHAAVLAGARALLAEDGLDALTMRALADRLGVAPNALYSHVVNKAGLIDEVLDDVLAAVYVPDPVDEDPAAGLRALMDSTYEILLDHADLVPLYMARQGARGPNAQRLGAVVLALLARTGVTGQAAREALRVLIVYAIGFAAFTTRSPLMPASETGPPPDELAQNFRSGLRWLLTGIGIDDTGRAAT